MLLESRRVRVTDSRMYVLFFSLRGCDSDELYEAVPSVISVLGVASSPFMLLGELIAYALVIFSDVSYECRGEVTHYQCRDAFARELNNLAR